MGRYYSAAIERDRKATMTKDKIMRIAKQQGAFRVSLRYRDDWLRARCGELKGAGLLVGGRRDGRQIVYYPAAAPRAAIKQAPTTDTDGSAAGPITRSGMNPENGISAPPPHSQGEA